MAEPVNSTALPNSRNAMRPPQHCTGWGTAHLKSLSKMDILSVERLAAGLIFPALVLIALAGFAQPEVLRHGGAKPHPTVIALAEVAR